MAFGGAALLWPDELPHEVLLLRDIKLRMRRNVARLPNYTCLETIARGQRAPERFVVAVPGKSVPFRRTDVVRLEVAEVGHDELFAHPGEHDFQKREISEFVRGGLIGNGIFSLFAHNVFLSNIATYKFRGEEPLDGRALIHFDYKVPQMLSGYRFTTTRGRAIIGYHGSFWVDPKSLDLVRMDIIADDIPPELGVADSRDRIDYSRVHIGGADALLPQSAEMTVLLNGAGASRNQIAFTHCREYGVESVIKFDDPAESGESAGLLGSSYVDLPPGLQLILALDAPIDAATAHIGDLITAIVETDAKHKNALAVPKDAVVTGRLRRLEVHKEGWPYVLAGLEFTQIEFNGKQSRFFAELQRIILPEGSNGPKRVIDRELPGVGMISAMGNNLLLPKGTRLIWKTLSYEESAK
jgi:hypothetical protein